MCVCVCVCGVCACVCGCVWCVRTAKGTLRVFSMRPTSFIFTHKRSICVCVRVRTASVALHGKVSIETCFSNWVTHRGVRGSERRKCVMRKTFIGCHKFVYTN
jgi:hypothetical protein